MKELGDAVVRIIKAAGVDKIAGALASAIRAMVKRDLITQSGLINLVFGLFGLVVILVGIISLWGSQYMPWSVALVLCLFFYFMFCTLAARDEERSRGGH